MATKMPLWPVQLAFAVLASFQGAQCSRASSCEDTSYIQVADPKVDSNAEAITLPIERFTYLFLSQGGGPPPRWLEDVAKRSDTEALWGYYGERHESTSRISELHMPGTTWATGRNRLYEEALDLQTKQKWRFEYLIFTDEDSEISFTAGNATGDPYTEFFAALSNVQPAVASVSQGLNPFTKETTTNHVAGVAAPCAPNSDAFFTAFHATAAPIFLPYDPKFDENSWFNAPMILHELLTALAFDYTVQFNQFKGANNGHSKYPQDSSYIKKPAHGYSKLAIYLREKVHHCARDRIGLKSMYAEGGGRANDARACSISKACDTSVRCFSESTPQEMRDYSELIKCKP